jgi:hypothetical protein
MMLMLIHYYRNVTNCVGKANLIPLIFDNQITPLLFFINLFQHAFAQGRQAFPPLFLIYTQFTEKMLPVAEIIHTCCAKQFSLIFLAGLLK